MSGLLSSETELTGLRAWSEFSLSTGFEGEIWAKVSWNPMAAPSPETWPKKKDGSPIHRVFAGVATSDRLTLQECRFAGKDSKGKSKWKPTGEPRSFAYLRSLADAGATVYFYPCQPHGGLSNSHVRHSRLCFYEIDDCSIEQQWEVVQRLQSQTGLQPCAIVHTGGKSLHVYFRLSEPVAPDKWLVLNRKLTIAADGDPAICNSARAMRLPGVSRRLPDGSLMEVSLKLASQASYTPEDFERRLDSLDKIPHELTQELWLHWRRTRKSKETTMSAGADTPAPPALSTTESSPDDIASCAMSAPAPGGCSSMSAGADTPAPPALSTTESSPDDIASCALETRCVQERTRLRTRLPAVLYQHYGQHLIPWLWARTLDDSWDKHGKNLGQGRITFKLSDLAAAVNRSISTVRRWLAGARDKGLIWRFQCTGDVCRLWYCSLERVAARAGVKNLGAVAWIEIGDLKNLRIHATEIVAQGLQRQSLWKAKEAAKKTGIKEPRVLTPDRLFLPCDLLARVVGRTGRFLFVSEGFILYGASQKLIAGCRDVSPRTVSRHLSNTHRLQTSPVRGYRSEVDPCWKAQLAQRVRRSLPVETLKASPLQELHDEGQRLIRGPNNRWFFLKTNIYWFDWQLSRQRYRREHLKKILEVPSKDKRLQELVSEEGWTEWSTERTTGIDKNPL